MAIVGATMQIAFWSVIVPAGILVSMNLFKEAFYTIGTMLFWVIDILQRIFRKLAGLDSVWVDGVEEKGDILTSIFRSSIVVDTLIAVSVFAVALVIIGSIVQMVRTEYTTEGSKNSKESILGKALKSLVMFVLIPVVCFFGIRVSNYLLQAVDYATSSGGSQTMSGAIFNAATVDANRISNDIEDNFNITKLNISGLLRYFIQKDWKNGAILSDPPNGSEYYVMGFQSTLKTTANSETKARQVLGSKIDQLMALNEFEAKVANKDGYGDEITNIGRLYYRNPLAVGYFYDFSRINMLVLYVGAYLVLQSLFNASMGLVVRMYKCTALFVLAPAAIGLQPLDDGAAYKKWKGGFISNVLAAYGVIVALNLFFTVSSIVTQINLWDPSNGITYGLNKFMQALFVVVGATQIKALAKMVGDMIGAANAMEEGASAVGEVGKLAQGMGKMAGGIAKGGAFAVSGAKAIAGKFSTAKTKNDLDRLDADVKSGKITEKQAESKRAMLTERLETREAKRQINAGRAKGIFDNSGFGKMLGDVTGGVTSVLSGKAFKSMDEDTMKDMTGKVKEQAGEYTKQQSQNYEDRKDRVGTAIVTGGFSEVATKLAGVIGGFGTAIAHGFKHGSYRDTYRTLGSAGRLTRGEYGDDKTNESAASFSRSKLDAHESAEEQYNLATSQNKAAKQQIIEDADARGGSLYRRQQLSFSNAFSGISGLANGASMSSADVVNMSARVQTLKTALAGNEGSEAYKFADSISNILSGISAGSGASPEQQKQIKSIVDGANAGYLSKEYATTLGAATETRTAIGEIHAKQAKIDTDKTDVDADIETAGDNKGINEALQKFSEAMAKDSEEGDKKLRDALEAAASAGITIKGTNGDPLKIDSKQFVDELKKVRQSVEEANTAKAQKEMAKTMQDLLKEYKKKK